jgi:nucleoside-diphosphate-sugar epimerase
MPLAEVLVQAGYPVKGSTTTLGKMPLLEEKRVQPFFLDLSSPTGTDTLDDFLKSDILLLNIPPRAKGNGGAAYLEQIRLLLKALEPSPIQKVLFISSTSVLPDLNRIVTEADVPYPEEESQASPLLRSEILLRGGGPWATTIIRFGGLVGGSRHPGRFLAGKNDLPNGDAPVNLIHLNDCIRIILQVVEEGIWNTDFLACADEHPSRREFYTRAALLSGLTPPQFREGDSADFKIVCNRKLKEELGFSFSYPDPYMMISGQVPSEV